VGITGAERRLSSVLASGQVVHVCQRVDGYAWRITRRGRLIARGTVESLDVLADVIEFQNEFNEFWR